MLELFNMCSSWKFLILLTIYVSGQDPAVVLPQGRIAGIKVYPKNSMIPIEIYFGVPFAIPPTGRYRFSAPERHPGWRRTFFAHRRPPRCPQFGDTENDSVSEDCLFLNIWTPQRADKKTLPVVVILYSESWSNGGATSLPCEEIASDGIVVVTVSYRLHILGFFTVKSILARGNLALLDQYLALLWIRENIAAFGGDPTSITLMGHSFGADCVLHHIVSRRATGLFQRAIIMSPRYIWQAIDDENVGMDILKISKEFARGVGCSGSDEEIVHCLRDRPFVDILRTYRNSNWTNAILPIPDTFLPESEQYLPRSLSAALSATKQPTTQLDLLLGTTDLEAINFDHVDYEELSRRGASYIIEYATNKGIPELFRMLSMSPDIHPMLVEAVRWEFWGPKGRVQNANVESLRAAEALARADSSVKWGVGAALLAARLARRFSRLYVYRFTQPSGVDLRGHQLNYTGAVHGTDLVALLGDAMLLQVARRPATVDEQRTSTRFRRYIVNFAKFGSPEIEQEWPRYKAGEAYVQNIRDNVDLLDHIIAERHVAFWLQYLPHLTSTVSLSEGTEQLHLTAGETRLRGGVFALCGIMLVLLALLCACAVLLRWERTRHHSIEATE